MTSFLDYFKNLYNDAITHFKTEFLPDLRDLMDYCIYYKWWVIGLLVFFGMCFIAVGVNLLA